MLPYFDINNERQIPNLELCCPDRKTRLGMLFPVNNVTIALRFGTISELTFTIPSAFYDSVQGKYINVANYDKLKPQLLIESNTIDGVYSVPIYDDDGNITSREGIDIRWWVINSVDESFDGVVAKKTVKAFSYEHTLKRRNIYLTASQNVGATSYRLHSNNQETTYMIQGSIPYDGIYFNKNFKSDIKSVVDNYNKTHTPVNIEYVGATGQVNISITESELSTMLDVFGYNEYLSIDEFLTRIVVDYLYSQHYKNVRSISSASLKKELEYANSLLEIYSESNGVSDDYYLTRTTYDSIIGMVVKDCPSWSVGSVSPSLRSKYSYIQDMSANAYDLLMTTVSKNYECFPVFDNTNLKIHLLTKSDFVDCLNSGFHLGLQNAIKETNVTSDTNEPCTALAVYSENTTDYDMGLINPTGDNIIYNFDTYKEYMPDSVSKLISNWTHKIDMFSDVSKAIGRWIIYYSQQKQRWQTKMATALENYADVCTEINTYKDVTTKMAETYSLSANQTSYGWYNLPTNSGNIGGAVEPYTWGHLKGVEVAWNNGDTTYISRFHSTSYLGRLIKCSERYYKYRHQYNIAAFKYYLAAFYRKVIYKTCVLSNTPSLSKVNKFMTNKQYYGSENNTFSMYSTLFNNKGAYKLVVPGYVDEFNKIVVNQSAIPFEDKTIDSYNLPSVYPYTGGSSKANIKNYFNSKNNTYDMESFYSCSNCILSGVNYRKDIDKYIMNGTWTNSDIKFPDIIDVGSTGVIKFNTDTVINNLSKLKSLAISDHVQKSQDRYTFSITPINFLFMSEYKDMLNKLYLGSVVKAEVSPNNWVETYLLELQLNYDSPSDVTMTFSNDYRSRLLKFKFADLYRQLSQNTTISNSYTSDLYSSN